MRSIKKILNPKYKTDGFEIHNLFSKNELNNTCIDLYKRMKLQAYKIGLTEDRVFNEYNSKFDINKLDKLIVSLHKKIKDQLTLLYKS